MRTLPLTDQEISAWLRLVGTKGIGPVAACRLLAAFGLPEQIFNQAYAALAHVVGPDLALTIQRPPADDFFKQVEHTVAWTAEPGNHLVTLSDPAYPSRLLNLPNPPPLLYVKGQLELLHMPSIAIVGSRHATAQGLTNAEQFARALAAAGFAVVSGLALGIDSAAHGGALNGHSGTIAVMGTGANLIYPACHRQLAHKIVTHGALVCEWPLDTPARAQHFPQRNRLIAALAQGVLVVEATAQSGSLITARIASELGREVFALPGSIHSPLVKGCHQLIKVGAKLVESVSDILDELGLQSRPQPPAKSIEIKKTKIEKETKTETKAEAASINTVVDIDALALDVNARCVLSALGHKLGHHPATLEALTVHTGLTSATLQATLLQLELSGWVAALPGGRVTLLKPIAADADSKARG